MPLQDSKRFVFKCDVALWNLCSTNVSNEPLKGNDRICEWNFKRLVWIWVMHIFSTFGLYQQSRDAGDVMGGENQVCLLVVFFNDECM